MCNNFIKVPKNIIEGDDSLLYKYGVEGVLVYLYMLSRKTRIGYTYFTLENVILESKHKLNRNKGKSNDKFREVIINFINDGYLKECNFNLKTKTNSITKCVIDDVDESYFKLHIDELKIISNYCGKSYDKILLIFLYIKSKIYRRSKTEALEHDKFEIAFPSYDNISNNLKIDCSYMAKYIEELSQLNLIKYKKIPDMIDKNNNIIYGNNIYVDCIGDWEKELKGGFLKYVKIKKNKGYSIIKTKDKRSLGGKKSALLKKIVNNTATEKDYDELKKISLLIKNKNT